MGDISHSQSTARRILEYTGNATYTLAIPPKSPPGPDELDIET